MARQLVWFTVDNVMTEGCNLQSFVLIQSTVNRSWTRLRFVGYLQVLITINPHERVES